MQQDDVKAIFDSMAETYDKQWVELAPINAALHLLTGAAFANVTANAKILCIGAGTGAEIIYLAKKFPAWTFTAVDPSAAMLEVCRRKLTELGLENRCEFHAGYLQSLGSLELFDAATSMLVSQFIQDKKTRVNFFKSIAHNLKPGGMLVSSDLSAQLGSTNYRQLLAIWFEMMKAAGATDEGLQRMRVVYEQDVAIVSEQELAAVITSAGFNEPVCFYQAGLIRAWSSVRGAGSD